jgi:uncharacterized protein YbbC (DUF1343 family)
MMEACAATETKLIILDRPNPNGWYTHGPVMDDSHTSFLGVHPGVPIVHGMTLGEYAAMANNEGWLRGGLSCPVEVIHCQGYAHGMRWDETGLPWHPPSPNLRSVQAAELYPGLTWFEQTPVSVGRGTDAPFERVGFPYHTALEYRWKKDTADGLQDHPINVAKLEGQVEHFTPQSQPGKALHPKYEGRRCWGIRFTGRPRSGEQVMKLGLELLLNFHHEYHEHHKMYDKKLPGPFFREYFEALAGTSRLRDQIGDGQTPAKIIESWAPGLRKFRRLRARYLRYPSVK